jgi:glutamate 5-kinase
MKIVVKIGTNVLTDNSDVIQTSVVKRLTAEIFELRQKGHEVVLVSSGAVGSGRARLPALSSAEDKQIWAAVGQPYMMQLYGKYAAEFNAEVGQLLILRSELTDKERYANLTEVINGMLKAGVLPIINGNDVISKADLTTGDNDVLAGMVAAAIAADKLIILTNQEGFFTADPNWNKKAELIKEVKNVGFELERLCSIGKSTGGRGGMLSKVRAARQATNAGVETIIADGRTAGVLAKALDSPHIGTKFLPIGAKDINEKKRWLLAAKGFGQLVVDGGAAAALHKSKSLLLPGIISCRGMFDKGEIVEVVDKAGLAVAYGKVNYSLKEIQDALALCKDLGRGRNLEKEVIHADHMAVIKTP